MAIFERRLEQKVVLDDTEAIACHIETAQNIDGHTEYVLRVQRGPYPENSWRILRRYNDFASLNKCLQISGIELPFPGKKFIGNMRPEFIAERLSALQEYLNQVLMNPILASSLPTKKFIDPDSYSTPFHDLALQYASMCLRTEGVYTLGQSLGPIGWRLRKHYFKVVHKPQGGNKHSPGHSTTKHHLIKSSSQSHGKQHTTQVCVTTSTEKDYNNSKEGSGRDDLILTWTEFGPDRYIDEKEIHNVLKNFGSVQHPYIVPIEYIASNDNGALVIRKFYKQGSLKDVLCGVTSPCNPFLSKYGSPKGRAPLPLKELALYARQILEAIRFLHSKGLACGHVHCGNVQILDGVARLMDVENFLFGVPSFYRPFFVQHSKINSCESIDVYGFGHLLYEMCMGYPLQDSYARQITDCPDSLKSLLESILLKDACKSSLPTLDQLASHAFFSEYAATFNEQYAAAIAAQKPHLKFSTNAKEQLKLAVQKTENRVRDEQKSVKNQKRLVRVQEMMTSEEEKKKIKQKAKQEHRQAKLRAQNSLQLNNGPPTTVTVSASSGSAGAVMFKSDSANSITSPHDAALMSPPPHGAPDSGGSGSSPLRQPPPSAPPIPPPNTLALFDQALQAAASGGGGGGGGRGGSPNQQHLKAAGRPQLNKSISGDDGYCSTTRNALLDSICNFNKSGLKKVSSSEK